MAPCLLLTSEICSCYQMTRQYSMESNLFVFERAVKACRSDYVQNVCTCCKVIKPAVCTHYKLIRTTVCTYYKIINSTVCTQSHSSSMSFITLIHQDLSKERTPFSSFTLQCVFFHPITSHFITIHDSLECVEKNIHHNLESCISKISCKNGDYHVSTPLVSDYSIVVSMCVEWSIVNTPFFL
jgi:hypothetical protein